MATKNLKIWDWAPRDWEKYDLCLVFPVQKRTFRLEAEAVLVIKNLCKLLGKRYLYAFYSEDSSKIYLLIRTRLKLLRAKAHSEGWALLLDEDLCALVAYAGNEADLVDSFAVPHRPDITAFHPFKYIYARYVSDKAVDELYHRRENMRHPFHKTLRLKMLEDFLRRFPMAHEYNLALDHLQSQGLVKEFFAVHDPRDLHGLATAWLDYLPTLLPLQDIRHYFGEKLAFYFAFLDGCYYWSLPIAVVGVGLEIPALLYNTFSRPEIPAFSFFIMTYAILGAQYWKRCQQIEATKWNVLNCEESSRLQDHVRSSYSGALITSFIDGKQMLYFHPRKRWCLYFVSFLGFSLSLALALIGVAAIYFGRWQLTYAPLVPPYKQWIAGGATAVQIMLCNWFFYHIARGLTYWENHRLEMDHELSLTVKVFLFQTTNALSSFYYLAFAAEHMKKYNEPEDSLGECGFDNCMQPLAINMTAVVGTLAAYRAVGHFLPSVLNYKMLAGCCGRYRGAAAAVATASSNDNQMQPILELQPMKLDHEEEDHLHDIERTLANYMEHQQSAVWVTERGERKKSADDEESNAPQPRRQSEEFRPLQTTTTATNASLHRSHSHYDSHTIASESHMDEKEHADGENASEEEEEEVANPFVCPRPAMEINQFLIRNYSHLFTLLAIAICFGSTLPAVFLILAVYLYIENRGQAWQLIFLYPRCLPAIASGIGLWASLLDLLLVTGTLTNASLIILTMKQFKDWSMTHRLMLWIGIVAFHLVWHVFWHCFFARLPDETVIQRQRMQFITSKLIERLPDKEDTLPIDLL
eukprot:gene7219-7985_t